MVCESSAGKQAEYTAAAAEAIVRRGPVLLRRDR
jgi:hypothetical protein